jgi:hypothetical protein
MDSCGDAGWVGGSGVLRSGNGKFGTLSIDRFASTSEMQHFELGNISPCRLCMRSRDISWVCLADL